jgi:hypothetical protein
VAFPASDSWRGKFGISLCNMMCYLMAKQVPGYRNQQMTPCEVRGSILPRSRHKLVRRAQQLNCSHILFIDTDQTFPKDTAHRLLAWDKEVVGCNVATKQLPASPTARGKSEKLGGEMIYTDPDSPLLEKAWRLGTGVMLMKLNVFEKLGPACWEIRYIPELDDYQGEDWRMCELLEEHKIPIWIDQRLSDQIGHVGEFEFKHEHVGEKTLVEDKQIGEK